jgi:hypothetical protein
MTRQWLQVVQFVHPGFEYHRAEHVGGRTQRSGVMPWKPGRSQHDRKFMLTPGSLFDPDAGEDHTSVPVGFWGEWEGPSVFWRVDSPGRPLPTIVHAPFRPAHWPTASVQNTDPMVFGDAFIYSNCLQAAYRSLRTLGPGSMVLFGRYARTNARPSFSLDTCLVIEHVETLAPAPVHPGRYGNDLLTDAVLGPLFTEGADRDLSVYFGPRRSPDGAGPFSFFPARLAVDSPPLFARPELSPTGALDGVISPGNMQGIKVTSQLSITDRDAVWAEIVAQVHRQGCGLGHHAAPPPLLEPHLAESAARNAPMPLIGTSVGEERTTSGRESVTCEAVDLVNGFVPVGTTVDGPSGLERVLAHWAEESNQARVGDVGGFGGSPVLIVRMGGEEFVLNRDTKRAAVLAFLAAASTAGGADKLRWHVPANKRGTITRVTYRSDDEPTPGWYAYLRTPAPEPREL